MKRPLLMALGIFLMGELAGQLMDRSIWYPCAAAVSAGGILWRSNRLIAKEKKRYSMLLLFLFILGFVWNIGVRQHASASEKRIREAAGGKETIILEGVVTDVREKSFFLSTEEGRIRILSKNTGGLADGDRLQVAGIPEEIGEATNPGGFDSREYYEGEGVYWQMEADKILEREEGADWLRTVLGRLRRVCHDHIFMILPEKEAGVLSAMLLGEKAGVDRELKELYRENGIAHILAISGLHVSLIGSAFLLLLSTMGLSRRAASLVTVFFLFFYGMLTGFAPATMRAVWMLTAVCLAGAFQRTADLPTSAGGALFLMLILQPWRIISSGAMMSFLAMAGVVAQGELYKAVFGRCRFERLPVRLRTPVKRILGMLLLGPVLQCFLQPVLIRDYYSVTPYSMLLNLLVVPLLSVAVCSGALSLLLSFLPGAVPVAEAAALPCKWILGFYEWICRGVSRLPGHEILTGHISTAEALILTGTSVILVLLLRAWIRKRRRGKGMWSSYFLVLAGLIIYLMSTAGYAVLRNNCVREVVFLDVGQGDGCLVHMGDVNLLMDCGSSSLEDVGTEVLLPALRYYGIDHLDGVFVSHTDADHINGIETLLEKESRNGIRVDTLFFAEGTLTDESMQRLLTLSDEGGTRVDHLRRGEAAELREIRIETLLPGEGESGAGNEYSLVLLLRVEDLDILFTGDIGEETEEKLVRILEAGEYTPEILKVPHHGSRFSSSGKLLHFRGWSAPEGEGEPVAVISCGRRNLYGHPSQETLERLSEAGFRVFRTDRQGAVVLELP